MKNNIVIIALLLVLNSCAVLTTSQVKLVNNLSVVSDSVAVAPEKVFESLAAVRQERGLFYAASLTSAEARFAEMNALAEAAISDDAIVKKADLYVNVLNSYLRSLKSISNDARWEDTGRELRGIGRNIDSVLIAYNKIYPDDKVETGIAKQLGKNAGYLAEGVTKRRQAVIVKEFVNQGDTLVQACCDALIELLKKRELEELLDNEDAGLEANYRAYLNGLEMSRLSPEIDNDRRYLELKEELYDARKMRDRCVTSLRSLKKAHAKVLKELQERKKIDQVYEEMMELYEQAVWLWQR